MQPDVVVRIDDAADDGLGLGEVSQCRLVDLLTDRSTIPFNLRIVCRRMRPNLRMTHRGFGQRLGELATCHLP